MPLAAGEHFDVFLNARLLGFSGLAELLTSFVKQVLSLFRKTWRRLAKKHTVLPTS